MTTARRRAPPEPAPSDRPSPAADAWSTTTRDPRWVVELQGDDALRRRVDETLLTLADGRFGTRGTRDELGQGYEPLVMASGVYAAPDGEVARPLPGPLWFAVGLARGDLSRERRWLDLREGVLYRQGAGNARVRALRFASLSRPGTMVSRIETAGGVGPGDPTVVPDTDPGRTRRRADGTLQVIEVSGRGGIAGAISTDLHRDGGRQVLDRIAVLAADPHRAPATEPVVDELVRARAMGVDRLLAEQRGAWAARWRDARVEVEGDPELELAVRFGLFHVMSSVADRDEAAVGARGLSGPGYAGHVFWDAEVFVLPFLAATHPSAARAMLEYRLRRLDAARERARREGRAGARFPWESAADGTDATPRSMKALDGTVRAIRTGQLEEHIVADVAWAADLYARWSGDRAFLEGPGGNLLVETARYWASRIETDDDGSGHIRGVIGPDEYHEDVDDNAYTNVMARWNLRRGAALLGSADDEAKRWRDLADRLADGYEPDTGCYEQFTGYWHLAPFDLASIAEPPVAVDVLLGRDAVAATRVIKQADVLMLHHVVPDEVATGSLVPNLDAYLPVTAHGSSLSPAIHASLLARAGRSQEAVGWLRLAARLDLDDRTGTTASGLHLATMGGVWQALAFGFLGVSPSGGVLHVDPRPLPNDWQRLELCVRFQNQTVVVRHHGDRVEVLADGEIPVVVADRWIREDGR